MTEELLTKMKEELEIEKQKLANYNRRIKRIRELENDGNVQEFLKLTNLEYESLLIKRISSNRLIEEVFYHHLHEIDEKDYLNLLEASEIIYEDYEKIITEGIKINI